MIDGSTAAANLLGRVRGKLSAGDWLPVVRRLPQADGRVGFSYDDGPAPAVTPALIEVLRRHAITATFFLNGARAAAAMELVGQLVEAGHDVFPHGWHHIRYDAVPADDLLRDLDRTEALLSRLRPTPSPYLVRLPYGAGHTTARVHRALRRWNGATQIAHWDYLTQDWRLADGCTSLDQLRRACAAAAARIVAGPTLPGAILLLHETPFDVTAALAPQIAPVFADLLAARLSERGLRGTRLVPVAAPGMVRRFIRG